MSWRSKHLYSSAKFSFYPDPEKAWEIIEMGRDIDEMYPECYKTEIIAVDYYKQITPILIEGEKCTMLEGKLFGYAITSYGRVINVAKNNKIILVYFGENNITSLIREEKVRLNEEFAKQGWEFIYSDIRKIYKENQWKIKVHRNQIKYL